MAEQHVVVGAIGGDAVTFSYDYEDTTDRLLRIYYKNALATPAAMGLYKPDGTLVFSRTLPPNTPETTVEIPAGMQPSVSGYGVRFGSGISATAR